MKNIALKVQDMYSLFKRYRCNNYKLIDVPNPHNIVSSVATVNLVKYIHSTYGVKEFIGVAYRNGKSDHEKGLALDIICNSYPFLPRKKQAATMNQIVKDLINQAERYNIRYIIWQNNIAEYPTWAWHKNITSTSGRTNSDLHMDHIHVSFFSSLKNIS